jgi:hypothetical protein
MSTSAPTLCDALALTGNPAQDTWAVLRDRLEKEEGGGAWSHYISYVEPHLPELFDVSVHDVLVGAWDTLREVVAAVGESEAAPDDVLRVALADHTIESEHHPYVQVSLDGVPPITITFTAKMTFAVKAFCLRIQAGRITAIEAGTCEASGTVEFNRFTILASRPAELRFPGTIELGDHRQPRDAEARAAGEGG